MIFSFILISFGLGFSSAIANPYEAGACATSLHVGDNGHLVSGRHAVEAEIFETRGQGAERRAATAFFVGETISVREKPSRILSIGVGWSSNEAETLGQMLYPVQVEIPGEGREMLTLTMEQIRTRIAAGA